MSSKFEHKLLIYMAYLICCLPFGHVIAKDVLQLNCGDLPSITLDGNRYLAKGKGENLTAAIEQAQQQLSQMLNTRVSTSCSDQDGKNSEAAENKQTCSLKSFSSNRFAHTPVYEKKQCEGGVLALISLDLRPLLQRLQSTFPSETGGLADKIQPTNLSFSALIRLLKAGELSLEFDGAQRLWIFRSHEQHLFVSQDDLWEGIRWQGCTGRSEFQLKSWGETIRDSQNGMTIDLALTTDKQDQTASLFELNQYGGVEVIAENMTLAESDPFKHQQLEGITLEGQVRSSYVYLLALRPETEQLYLIDSTQNPGAALSALLKYLIEQDGFELCARPMAVYK